jgi:hypothetical protein
MEQTDKKFVEGLRVFRPREGVPEFIKLNFLVDRPSLLMWLESQAGDEIRFDLKESKGGKLYCELNTWKATSTPQPKMSAEEEYNSLGQE